MCSKEEKLLETKCSHENGYLNNVQPICPFACFYLWVLHQWITLERWVFSGLVLWPSWWHLIHQHFQYLQQVVSFDWFQPRIRSGWTYFLVCLSVSRSFEFDISIYWRCDERLSFKTIALLSNQSHLLEVFCPNLSRAVLWTL